MATAQCATSTGATRFRHIVQIEVDASGNRLFKSSLEVPGTSTRFLPMCWVRRSRSGKPDYSASFTETRQRNLMRTVSRGAVRMSQQHVDVARQIALQLREHSSSYDAALRTSIIPSGISDSVARFIGKRRPSMSTHRNSAKK